MTDWWSSQPIRARVRMVPTLVALAAGVSACGGEESPFKDGCQAVITYAGHEYVDVGFSSSPTEAAAGQATVTSCAADSSNHPDVAVRRFNSPDTTDVVAVEDSPGPLRVFVRRDFSEPEQTAATKDLLNAGEM